MTSKAFDLPLGAFPVKLEILRSDTKEIVETIVVEGPGVLDVKPWKRILGVSVGVRMIFGDGEVTEHWPDE